MGAQFSLTVGDPSGADDDAILVQAASIIHAAACETVVEYVTRWRREKPEMQASVASLFDILTKLSLKRRETLGCVLRSLDGQVIGVYVAGATPQAICKFVRLLPELRLQHNNEAEPSEDWELLRFTPALRRLQGCLRNWFRSSFEKNLGGHSDRYKRFHGEIRDLLGQEVETVELYSQSEYDTLASLLVQGGTSQAVAQQTMSSVQTFSRGLFLDAGSNGMRHLTGNSPLSVDASLMFSYAYRLSEEAVLHQDNMHLRLRTSNNSQGDDFAPFVDAPSSADAEVDEVNNSCRAPTHR